MLENLTQQQQWGWAYELQLHNAQVRRQNASLAQYPTHPVTGLPVEMIPELSLAQLVSADLGAKGDRAYSQLLAVKERMVMDMFYDLPADQQQAMLSTWAIPDILT